MDKSKFRSGEVVSWQSEGVKQRTLAALADDGMFQIAIHYKGDSSVNAETFEKWLYDEVPSDVEVRKATADEFLEFIWALVENNEDFRVECRRVYLQAFDNDVVVTDEISRWDRYLTALTSFFNYHHTLNGASDLRKECHVGGLTKEQFFKFGLDKKDYKDIDIKLVCKIINSVKSERKPQNKK